MTDSLLPGMDDNGRSAETSGIYAPDADAPDDDAMTDDDARTADDAVHTGDTHADDS